MIDGASGSPIRCSTIGIRVQESVFHCLIEPALAEEMMTRVRRIIEEHTNNVHVLTICESCAGRVATMGLARKAEDPEYFIV